MTRVNKFEHRQGQLALSALVTLSSVGYARTSLREIARNSGFSHGIFHYYFRDKCDLVIYCVKRFSSRRVALYDRLASTARSSEELKSAFGSAVSVGLLVNEEIHRMWYDLRNQSLFEASLRVEVVAIEEVLQSSVWRICTRYAALSSKETGMSKELTYAAFDGLINQVLTRNPGNIKDVVADLHSSVESLLSSVVR